MNFEDIHFISLNVRGIRDALKRKKIFLWLKRQKCDIAFLQETFLSCDIEHIVSSEWKGFSIFEHGTNHSKGVAILVRKDLQINVIDTYFKGDGRSIALRFSCQNLFYLCLNVFAPAKMSTKNRFMLYCANG